jgi:hypothetical protein
MRHRIVGLCLALILDGSSATPTELPQTAFASTMRQGLPISVLAAKEAACMASRQKRARRSLAKMILRLPDLEQSKNAVLNSLAAPSFRE